MKKVRTRFAPSPTGYMHIGNLRTALYEYLVAKKDHGDFLLRIEDTDQERFVEGATDIIYETLKQCKLYHDEGPDIGGPCGPYVQSERVHSGIYKTYAEELIKKGKAHYCFCNQDAINQQRQLAEAKGISFKYDDPCKHLPMEEIEQRIKEEAYVIRQNIPSTGTTSFKDEVYGTITVENETLDESILLKSDGFPTYNFANIIDDHLMGITHVVRGNEYLSSTPKYNLIYEAFGWDIPTYIHCPPVMKDEHQKLSKRNGDASFQDLVAKGYLPEAILNYIALLGWAPETTQEIYSLEELTQAFNVKRIGTSGAIFDIQKLTWMNGMYLRNMDEESYYQLVLPALEKAVKKDYNLKDISKILQQRINLLSEIEEAVDFFDELPSYPNEYFINKKMKTDEAISLKSLQAVKELYTSLAQWDFNTIHDETIALVSKLEIKNGQLLYPIRVALSGKLFTPGGSIELAHILGKEESLRRIDLAISQLQSK